jgi:hypothetical protein
MTTEFNQEITEEPDNQQTIKYGWYWSPENFANRYGISIEEAKTKLTELGYPNAASVEEYIEK